MKRVLPFILAMCVGLQAFGAWTNSVPTNGALTVGFSNGVIFGPVSADTFRRTNDIARESQRVADSNTWTMAISNANANILQNSNILVTVTNFDTNIQSQVTSNAVVSSNKMNAFTQPWSLVYSDGNTNQQQLGVGAVGSALVSSGVHGTPTWGLMTASATNVYLGTIQDPNMTNQNWMVFSSGTNLVLIPPATVLDLIGAQPTNADLNLIATGGIYQETLPLQWPSTNWNSGLLDGYSANQIVAMSQAGAEPLWSAASNLVAYLANAQNWTAPQQFQSGLTLGIGGSSVTLTNTALGHMGMSGNLDFTPGFAIGSLDIGTPSYFLGVNGAGQQMQWQSASAFASSSVTNDINNLYSQTAELAFTNNTLQSEVGNAMTAAGIAQGGVSSLSNGVVFTNDPRVINAITNLPPQIATTTNQNEWTASQQFDQFVNLSTANVYLVKIMSTNGLVFYNGLIQQDSFSGFLTFSGTQVGQSLNGSGLTNESWGCFAAPVLSTITAISQTVYNVSYPVSNLTAAATIYIDNHTNYPEELLDLGSVTNLSLTFDLTGNQTGAKQTQAWGKFIDWWPDGTTNIPTPVFGSYIHQCTNQNSNACKFNPTSSSQNVTRIYFFHLPGDIFGQVLVEPY